MSAGRSTLTRAAARTVFRRWVVAPVLALATVTVSVLLATGEQVGRLAEQLGRLAGLPLSAVGGFGTEALAAAAAEAGRTVARYDVLALVVATLLGGATIWLVAREVEVLVGR